MNVASCQLKPCQERVAWSDQSMDQLLAATGALQMSIQCFAPTGAPIQNKMDTNRDNNILTMIIRLFTENQVNTVAVFCLDQVQSLAVTGTILYAKIMFYIHLEKCKQMSWWRHWLAWIDVLDWSKNLERFNGSKKLIHRSQIIHSNDPWISHSCSTLQIFTLLSILDIIKSHCIQQTPCKQITSVFVLRPVPSINLTNS